MSGGPAEEQPDTLVSLLKRRASLAPMAPCIVHLGSGTTLTYQQVWEAARRLSELLGRHRVGRRDRVVFVVRNHWVLFPLLVACSSRRASLLPVDPDLHRDELSSLLADAAPALTIGMDGAPLPGAPGEPLRLTLSQVSSVALPGGAAAGSAGADAGSGPQAEIDEGDASDVALMIYTSGTTGSHKSVMLTGRNLLANAASLVDRYRIDARDRFFCTLPTHHMNAIMMTGLVPLTAGACICLSDILSFKNAKLYWKNIAELGITVCSLVPSIMALLLKLSPRGLPSPLPRLRFGFCGAAPLPASTWQRFEEIFGCPIYQGYGLTETTCWAVSVPMDGPRRWDTVGIPLDCDVKIDHVPTGDMESFLFDQNSQGEPGDAGDLARHRSGEVLIRGAIVGPGYYKNPRLTRESTTGDGFFRTGDLGYFDDEGSLHITGRIKDVIIKNGANVLSRDIDRVLCQHDYVREARTIGVPDELVGERICCVCVLEEGSALSEADLRSWVQSRLSRPMWPDAIVFMGYLPAGAAGKVAVNTLRKIVSGELAEEILASLNIWKYKRSQPSGPDKIRELLQRSLVSGAPIGFLAYWGCGSRDSLSDRDRTALERLRDFVSGARRVPQVTPSMTLILTDMHARNNHIPEERMERYFAAVSEHAAGLGMATRRLSDIWGEAGMSLAQIRADIEDPAFVARWEAEPLRARLVGQAAKHVEQGHDPETAARIYYLACEREGAQIAERHPSHIFVTYNPPEFDCVSPGLPKFYLYSYKEGTSVKPWFVDDP